MVDIFPRNGSDKKKTIPAMPPVERPRAVTMPNEDDHPMDVYPGRNEPQRDSGFRLDHQHFENEMSKDRKVTIAENMDALSFKDMLEFATEVINCDDANVIVDKGKSLYAVAHMFARWADKTINPQDTKPSIETNHKLLENHEE